MVSLSWAKSVRRSVNNGPVIGNILNQRCSGSPMWQWSWARWWSSSLRSLLRCKFFTNHNHLSTQLLQRLLKHVVRCYLRLSDNTRACEALCQCLPDQLKDETFAACLKDDKSTKHWLAQLLKNIEAMSSQAAGAQQQQGGQQPAQQHQPPKGLTQPPALA